MIEHLTAIHCNLQSMLFLRDTGVVDLGWLVKWEENIAISNSVLSGIGSMVQAEFIGYMQCTGSCL